MGASIGGGFQNTRELRVMKYNEALLSDDKKNWMKAVEEEYQHIVKSNVFKVVDRCDLPDGATVLSSTWAMKKKSNGTYRARLNARGFKQKDGEHFNSSNLAAPVTNAVSVRIFMVIMLMARWATYMLNFYTQLAHKMMYDPFLHEPIVNDRNERIEVVSQKRKISRIAMETDHEFCTALVQPNIEETVNGF